MHKMLNVNTQKKLKPKPTLIFKNCSCTRIIVHNWCTQHTTVVIIFPSYLPIITAQMMSSHLAWYWKNGPYHLH